MKYILICSASALIFAACNSSKQASSISDNTIFVKMEEPVPVTLPARDSVNEALPGSIQKKYAGYLKTTPDSIRNLKLYGFIDRWMNTRYLWGGTDEHGIDCSAFIQKLLLQVYSISIPRTSVQQFFTENIEPFGGRHYLAEGDLVFFRTMQGKIISHVGLYLGNNMFVNSSSTYGVSIASLKDDYWKKRFVAAGRVKSKSRGRS